MTNNDPYLSSPYETTDLSHVFIVTYGRSGSTALQNVLNSLDGYLIRGENNFALQGLYDSWQAIAKMHNEYGEEDRRIQSPWFGADLVQPNRFAEALADVFTREVLRPEADTKVVGFKEIRYIEKTSNYEGVIEFLLTAFKSAKIIFNKRPTREILQSQWWQNMPVEAVHLRIEKLEAIFEQYQRARPEQAIIMDHAEWSRSTEAFRPLMEFLEVPFNAQRIANILNTKFGH